MPKADPRPSADMPAGVRVPPRMRLHRYRDRSGQWRWTLYAQNGKKVANAGEGYKRPSTMLHTLRRIFPMFQAGMR